MIQGEILAVDGGANLHGPEKASGEILIEEEA
jgi:hypothetical protein